MADGSADGSAAETNAGPSRLMHRIAACNRTTVVDAMRRRRDEPPVNIDNPYPLLRHGAGLVRPRSARAARSPDSRAKPSNAAAGVPDAAIGGTTETGTDSALRTLRFRCRATPPRTAPHPVLVSVLLPIPPRLGAALPFAMWRSPSWSSRPRAPESATPRRSCSRAHEDERDAIEARDALSSARPARPRGGRTHRRAPSSRRDGDRRPDLSRGQPTPARGRHR